MGMQPSYRSQRKLPFSSITYPDNLSPTLYFKNTENVFLEDYQWGLGFLKFRQPIDNCTATKLLYALGLCESDFRSNDIDAIEKGAKDELLYTARTHAKLRYHVVIAKSERKSEIAVIFLHGHSTDPLKLFSGDRDYLNHAGRVLNDYGFDVYAPYVFSHSWGNTILSENGIMSGQGITSYGIDLLKIDALYKYLRGQYKHVVLYGISHGEILARIFMTAGHGKIDALILSGITLNAREYLAANYLKFLPIHYSHEEFLVRDFEVLMKQFGYRDWPNAFKSVPLILEIATSDPVAQNPDSVREFTSFLKESGIDVTYNFFEGFHETNPEVSAQLLWRRLQADKGMVSSRRTNGRTCTEGCQ